VSDSKKKANKLKETGSQEKPDNQAPRTHIHSLLMDLMRELFLGMGPMICITNTTRDTNYKETTVQ
jgi:hypothetical protein